MMWFGLSNRVGCSSNTRFSVRASALLRSRRMSAPPRLLPSLLVLGFGLLGVGGAAPAWSAQTRQASAMSKTQLVLKLAGDEVVPIQSRFEPAPPTIVIEFPPARVAGTMPDYSVIQRGAIQEIRTSYATGGPALSTSRWIRALRVRLRAAYPYHLRAEAGQILLDIEHPASVAGEAVEVGLASGISIAGRPLPVISERFHAMEEALLHARPPAWTGRIQPVARPVASSLASAQHATTTPLRAARAWKSRSVSTLPSWLWLIGVCGLIGAAAVRGWPRMSQAVSGRRARVPGSPMRLPAGNGVMEQLIWRAFERQGYQLLQLVELSEPKGAMRVITKDCSKATLLYLGEGGAVFEKTLVEQFAAATRKVQAEQGFLLAPGAFTVPAQRVAKEHGLTLLGREELMHVLSDGARSEHETKQAHALQTQVEEAKATINQQTQQVEVLRRQRNEASWYLGEERAKTTTLRAQLEECAQQIQQWQERAQHWEQTALLNHKQWEESQWYLGEARASFQHVEDQNHAFQEICARLEARHLELTAALQEAQRQRDDANRHVGELRAQHASLRQQLEQAQAVQPDALIASPVAESMQQERRRAPRRSDTAVTVACLGSDGAVLLQARPRDLSLSGFGVEASSLAALPNAFRVHLQVPDAANPIAATAQLVWTRQSLDAQRSLAGYEWLEMSTTDCQLLKQALTRPD